MALITRWNLSRSLRQTVTSSPLYTASCRSLNVRSNNAGEWRKVAITRSWAALIALPEFAICNAIVLRTYSTSKALSLLCSGHDLTVHRFLRWLSGKNDRGGTCSLVLPFSEHI